MEVEICRENQGLFEIRPRYWEVLLAVDQLERPLDDLASTAPANVSTSPILSRCESSEFYLQRACAFRSSQDGLRTTLEKNLPAAFGDLGQPGDPAAIVFACRLVLAHCQTLIQMEQEILRTPLHPDFHDLQIRFAGLAAEDISQVRKIVAQMRLAAEQERTSLFFDLSICMDRTAWLIAEASSKTDSLVATPPAPTSNASGCGGCVGWLGFFLIIAVISIVAPWWVIVIFVGLCLMASRR